jgi:hypothetical protein
LRFVATLFVLFILWSCTGNQDGEQLNLDYEMKLVSRESAEGCLGINTTPCARFQIEFPYFENLTQEVQEKFVDKVTAAIAYDNPETEGFSMEQMADQFIHDFIRFRDESTDSVLSWNFTTQFEVLLVSDTLISLAARSEYFTGGAHGGYGVYFVNISPATGDAVTLASFLKPGFENILNQEGEKAFRQVREIPNGESLDMHGFEFMEDSFEVNSNYGFREEGIVFVFNSYEIAAYALGPTEFLVPWESLGEWRR